MKNKKLCLLALVPTILFGSSFASAPLKSNICSIDSCKKERIKAPAVRQALHYNEISKAYNAFTGLTVTFGSTTTLDFNTQTIYGEVVANKKFSVQIYDQAFNYYEGIIVGHPSEYLADAIVVTSNSSGHVIVTLNYGDQDIATDCNSVIRDQLTPISFRKISDDNTLPNISGLATIINDVNKPMSVNDIKAHLTAHDDYDGDITSSIQVVSDNYTPNKTKFGSYDIKFSVSDKSGNTAYGIVTVKNVDNQPPVVNFEPNGGRLISLSELETTTPEQLKNKLVAQSDYSTSFTYDYDLLITNTTSGTRVQPNYLFTAEDIGKTLRVTVYDAALNHSSVDILLDVTGNNHAFEDDVKPIISGKTSWKVSYETVLDQQSIIDVLKVKDNYKDITASVKIKDFANYVYNKLGTYTVTAYYTDLAGNVGELAVNIEVVDEVSPFLYHDDFIIVNMASPLSVEKLVAYTLSSKKTLVNYSIIDNKYTKNSTTPGIYRFAYQANYIDGTSEVKNLSIQVAKTVGSTEVPTKSWWQIICDWFSNGFECIKNFFTGNGWRTDAEVK